MNIINDYDYRDVIATKDSDIFLLQNMTCRTLLKKIG
jgi:hypothetical protein